jgi:hypothetical protein
MKKLALALLLACPICAGADWLIAPTGGKAEVSRSESGKEVVMTNGLIRRVWLVME